MPRVTPMSAESTRQRAGAARAFLDTARASLEEAREHAEPSSQAQVAATNAIHAGIAASDAICGKRLGERSSSPDHAEAATLLATVAPGGSALANRLRRLVSRKTMLQYGDYCTAAKAEEAVRGAAALVDALSEHGL